MLLDLAGSVPEAGVANRADEEPAGYVMAGAPTRGARC